MPKRQPDTDARPIQITTSGAPYKGPRYLHRGDAGADLRSAIDAAIGPGERLLVPTGLSMAIPDGYVGLICPRSGLAARHGVTVLNAPGVIDPGYRGEIQVLLVNLDSRATYRLRRGDRVAQLLLLPCEHAVFVIATTLPSTDRGSAGVGSTGYR